MKKHSIIFFSILLITIIISCSKDEAAVGIDQQLFNMSKSASGFTWFKKSSAFLPKSSGTGHSESFVRTRFNATAMAKLGPDGKVMAGISFPEGSLIVKELYNDTNTVSKYAILYKQSSNANADSKGWVWGYFNGDGTTVVSASSKGSGCNGCHSQTGSIDYTLMNKYF